MGNGWLNCLLVLNWGNYGQFERVFSCSARIALSLASSALYTNWANPTDVAVAALMINLRSGWKAEMLAQLVADIFMMVVWRRGKLEAVMHHLDQSSQYTQ